MIIQNLIEKTKKYNMSFGLFFTLISVILFVVLVGVLLSSARKESYVSPADLKLFSEQIRIINEINKEKN